MNNKIKIEGKIISLASLEDEWDRDFQASDSFIEEIKKEYRNKADIFTFWQRLPDIIPTFHYHMEWDNVAALEYKTYDYWFTEILDAKNRNITRKAEKKGIIVKTSEFNDEFVKGIMEIYNETKIRQGKPFWHYGKTFSTVKKENGTNLESSEFIGAYYGDELVGFIKLVYGDRTARTEQIISKIKHRDKAPTNALIAKAIKICEEKHVPYLVYGRWPSGTLAVFKRNVGFNKYDVPRYFVPLNLKGDLAVKLGLHKGLKNILPERFKDKLIEYRARWHQRKN